MQEIDRQTARMPKDTKRRKDRETERQKDIDRKILQDKHTKRLKGTKEQIDRNDRNIEILKSRIQKLSNEKKIITTKIQ